MGAGAQIGLFLVNAVFSFYIIVVLLRFLLALVRANFYNPISQFVVTLTNPPLKLLRRIIPSVGRIDSASVVLLIALQIAEIYLTAWLQGITPPLLPVLLIALRELLVLLVYVYIGAIIVQALLSWVSPMGGGYNPVAGVLDSLTAPLLAPLRRVVPLIGMIDLTPLVALLLLNVALILVRNILG
ncbi:YggT family protein [Acidihalobacter prosperus]|uniref:Membrane protein n=1 Tax=Acidihalobacter prosperus TaxID=160660 RepID=A0A1A6C0Q5_9GAMM|nr:YggT family protein [Acidihalobacter prosperus]OBS08147.1 membrane protein [Acidihalobacter prosperus]